MKIALFDLDNTLVQSHALNELRLRAETGNLTSEQLATTKLFPATVRILDALSDQGVSLGLVTNATGAYTRQMLAHHGLARYFPAVVTHSDVGGLGAKPSPDGIRRAMDRLRSGQAIENCIHIGGTEDDVTAAYRAGVRPIVPAWAVTQSLTLPPAIELSSDMLIQYFQKPLEFRLFGERCAQAGSLNFQRDWAWFLPLDEQANVVSITKKMRVFCLGRYFGQKSATTARLHDIHPLSKEIARKDSDPNYQVPDYWISMLARIAMVGGPFVLGEGQQFDVVTVIPTKPGKPKRLEPMLKKIGALLSKAGSKILVDDGILYFDDGCVPSLKALRRDARPTEQNAHLHAHPRPDLAGKNVLIIDDVITSGATVNRALSLLEGYGAASYALALAKTVSILDERRICEKCGRDMQLRKNSQTGARFWSCSGYQNRTCDHTEAMSVGICPRCGGELIQRARKRDKKLFVGCRAYPHCKYIRD